MTEAELTVVVATRDRVDSLSGCLSALDAQRREIPLDVVVVDDRTVDVERLAGVVERAPGARLLASVRPGVCAARNTGVAHARTPFVAFVDDDCLAQPGWARALVERLRAGDAVVCGRTVTDGESGALAAATQVTANALFDARFPSAPASNIACRRDVALDVPFDEAFLDIGGEERDWFARLRQRDRAIEVEPRAIVLHRPPVGLADFWRKHVRYGRGAYRYRRRYESGQLEPPRFYGRLLRASFRQGPAVGLAVCVAQAATAVGFVTEAVAGPSE